METRYYYYVDMNNPYCEPREVYDCEFALLPLDFEEGETLIRVETKENETFSENGGTFTYRDCNYLSEKLTVGEEAVLTLNIHSVEEGLSIFCETLKALTSLGQGG